jgi:UDP-N-acetylglucosamine--N-acetylmuramyl-(pentapeptide) pyrophosphoryl-undecaprenol N-acetylglucosamine transferase
MTARVLMAGGGTGGHVFPSLHTATALQAARPNLEIEFVGTSRGLEARLVPEHGWTLHKVEALPFARRLSPQTLRLPLVLLRASGVLTRLIRDRNVVAALCFGGYVSMPLALAARRTRIPLVVHEQNAVPGLANRLAARWATTVALSVDTEEARTGLGAGGSTVVVTGNPTCSGFGELDRAALRAQALMAFDLDPGRRTLLVFGGSQGALRINQAIVASVGRWQAPECLQILHATGRASYDMTCAEWDGTRHKNRRLRVQCLSFIDRMDLAYAVADLVLCRAGASSIAELTVMGLPSILVPYPHATADHQTANARALDRAGAARLIPDAQLDADTLVTAAEPLLFDEAARARMAAVAHAMGRADAARALARLVLDAIAEGPCVKDSDHAGPESFTHPSEGSP